jgi:hypothetical protein
MATHTPQASGKGVTNQLWVAGKQTGMSGNFNQILEVVACRLLRCSPKLLVKEKEVYLKTASQVDNS